MTYINKLTGLPLADKSYNARTSGQGTKLEVTINRRWVEVSVKADVSTTPVPPVVVVPPVAVPAPTPVPTPTPTNLVTPDTFAAKLLLAAPGTTLLLAAGDYEMPNRVKFTTAVTVKSADPANPARFASLTMNGTEGLTLDGIAVKYTFKPSDPEFLNTVDLFACKRVTFSNMKVTGSGDAAGFGWGRGIFVDNCEDFTIENTLVDRFLRGIVISSSTRTIIKENEIKNVRSDGIDCISLDTVLIEKNHIHDFKAPLGTEDHPDFIQFWTSGQTKPSVNVTIRDNLLDVGQGVWVQNIFMRNEAIDQGVSKTVNGANPMYYRNVLIENNTIRGCHIHGITLGEAIDAIIRKNVLVSAKINEADPENAAYVKQFGVNAGIYIPRLNMAADSKVTISDNAYAGATWYTGSRCDAPGKTVTGAVTYATEADIPAGYGSSLAH